MKKRWHLIILIIFLFGPATPCLFGGEAPLQAFECSGMLKSLTIFEDLTRPNGRRIARKYIDDSQGNEFVTRVSQADYVSYQYEGNKEEIRYDAGTRKLEFWEDGVKVPSEIFAECVAASAEANATGVVRKIEFKKYVCQDMVVTVSQLSPALVRVKSTYRDGTTSEDMMSVLKGNGFSKWITEESQRREKSAWGKTQGKGFSSFHLRYDEITDQIQFWSQGGGKMKPANMHNVCNRDG
jgi:hypothetical protein